MSRRHLLSDADFEARVKAAGLGKAKSIKACRAVLVEGLSINAAARKTKIAPSTVSRMLGKIPTGLCPTCGQPVTAEKTAHPLAK